MIWHGLKSGTIMITSDSVLVHPLAGVVLTRHLYRQTSV